MHYGDDYVYIPGEYDNGMVAMVVFKVNEATVEGEYWKLKVSLGFDFLTGGALGLGFW